MSKIQIGDRVLVEKGCRTLGISKGVTAKVEDVKLLGAEYSHFVRVVLRVTNGLAAGKVFSLNARHENRLADEMVRLRGSRPELFIEVRKRES